MAISRSRRRKLALGVSLSRMSDSLCWTSGWSTTVTLIVVPSEHGAIAVDGDRRRAARTPLRGQPSTRQPGAPLEHLRQRQRNCVETQVGTDMQCHVVEQ